MAYNNSSIFDRLSLFSYGTAAVDCFNKLSGLEERRPSPHRCPRHTDAEDFDTLDCVSDDDGSLDSWSMASSEDWTHVALSPAGVTRASIRRGKVLLVEKEGVPHCDTISSVSSAEFLETTLDDSFFEVWSQPDTNSGCPDDVCDQSFFSQPEEVSFEDIQGCDLKTRLQMRLEEDQTSLLNFKINGYKLSDVESLIVQEAENDKVVDEKNGDVSFTETSPCKLSKKGSTRRRRGAKTCPLDYSFTAVQLWEHPVRSEEGKGGEEEWRVPSDAMFESLWRPEDDTPPTPPSEELAVHTTTRGHDHFPTQKQKKKTAQWSGRLSKTMRSKKSPY